MDYRFKEFKKSEILRGHLKLGGANPEGERIIEKGDIKLVTLTPEQANFIRRIDGEIYIGIGCNLYKPYDKIEAVENGSYSYLKWNGSGFERYDVEMPFENARVTFENVKQPFEPKYRRALEMNGPRQLTWKK